MRGAPAAGGLRRARGWLPRFVVVGVGGAAAAAVVGEGCRGGGVMEFGPGATPGGGTPRTPGQERCWEEG